VELEAIAADAADEAERAQGHYERGMTLGEEPGMRPLVGHCHLDLGKLYRRRRKREAEIRALGTS
jgi:hypothetical protein